MTEQMALLYSLCAVALLVESIVTHGGKAKICALLWRSLFPYPGPECQASRLHDATVSGSGLVGIISRQPQDPRKNGCS